MSLGDYFPESFRSSYAEQNIRPGTVIRAFVYDTNPPKEKRFIVVGVCQNSISFASVFINSEVNPNVIPNETIRDLHLPFPANGRDYLNHDSFVDCSRIYECNVEDFQQKITADPKLVMGELNSEDFKAVRSAIKSNRTVSIAKKKKYSLFY